MKFSRIRLDLGVWFLTLTLGCSSLQVLATEVPHVVLDITYEEHTRQVHIQATTNLSPHSPKFFLSKDVTLHSVDTARPLAVAVSQSIDTHIFSLNNGQRETSVTIKYSLMLPESNEPGVMADMSGRVDWSGSASGAFLPGSRIWYPFFNKASTTHLTVKTARGLLAIAPGLQAERREQDRYQFSVFDMPQPIVGIDLMIGAWVVNKKVISGLNKEITIQTYFNEGNRNLSEEYLTLCERYINFYEKLIGPYPYSSFTVVSSPFPTGLGMPSLTYLSEKILKYPFIKNRSLPHEIVHNWWGNGIQPTYPSGNWSEGLTTYLADYWQTELTNKELAKEMRYGWLRDYTSISNEDERSLHNFTSRYHTASSTIGYGKSAMVFHMLRNLIGDSQFITCLQEFWLQYQFDSAGFHDIRDTCQKHTSIDLTTFFDAWIPTVGAPRIRIELGHDASSKPQLSASQNGEWIFALDVEISSQEQTHSHTSLITDRSTKLNLPDIKHDSLRVKVDPNFNVWRELYPHERVSTLRDFVVAKHPIYIQLDPNIIDGSELISSHFLEHQIKEKHRYKFNNQENNITIVFGGVHEIIERLNKLGGAIDFDELADKVDSEFLMVSTNISDTPTLMIGITASVTEEKLALLIRRARHYGKYSWLSVSKTGRTHKGQWPIKDQYFEF
ncbi:MAG: M1 family metallopeptidase [Burkholderiales bacterium]|jgi:aminopeptidase N|tara:strand:- start:9692 stop:11704 length:2013 start_codon:yes stop_codon:yes gene_type:complete